MSNLHSEEQAYWRREDDSGHDRDQIELDWKNEQERALRELTGVDLMDVLWDHRDTLLALARSNLTDGIGIIVCAAVRDYAKKQADLSVFGRPMK